MQPSNTTEGSPRHRLENLAKEYESSPLQSVSIPATLTLTKPSRAKISGTFYFDPSQYIFFSARFLGMEVGSIMITNDSIFGKIKPGKMYLAEPLDNLKKYMTFDIYQLQSLLTGRVVVPGFTTLDSRAISRCSFSNDDNTWLVFPGTVPAGLKVEYILAKADNKLTRLSTTAKNYGSALMTFSDYTTGQRVSAPSIINFDVESGDKSMAAEINFNYSKLRKVDNPDKEWFTPKGYKKVALQDVLKALSNM